MRPRLIDDWRRWWRLWSIRLNAIGAALLTALMGWPPLGLEIWALMPDEVKQLLPPRAVMAIPLAFFLAAIAARLIKQKEPGRDDE